MLEKSRLNMKLGDVAVVTIIFVIPHLGALQLRPRDITLDADAAGREVADAVIGKIRSFMKERSDYEFLRRIAAVETDFGLQSSSTTNSKGGIWHIGLGIHNTLLVYESYTAIPELVEKIQNVFQLSCFVCEDMNYSIPIHSGLAAYIYIKMKFLNGNFPGTLSGQAQWWAQHYHEGGGAVSAFTDKAEEIDYHPSCDDQLVMDLWFLVDASNSVSETDFQTVKDFSGRLRNYFNSSTDSNSASYNKVRFGWSVYSFKHEVIFTFSDPQENFLNTISAATRQLGKAEIGYALESTLNAIENSKRNSSQLVHTVVLLVTTGDTDDNVEPAAEAIRNAGVTTYAIGINPRNTSKLETIASVPKHRFSYFLRRYSDLTTILVDEMIRVLCSTPIPLQKERNILMTLQPGMNLFVSLQVPFQDRIYVNFSTDAVGLGNVVYLSAAFSNPNSAFYDFFLYLYGGFSEIALSGNEFSELYPMMRNKTDDFSGDTPIYLTIAVPRDARSSTLQLNARTGDASASVSLENGRISTWVIVLIVAIAVFGVGGAIFAAVTIYRRSFRFQKSQFETKTRYDTEEALYVMKLLQSLTDLVRKPSATLPSMTLLQNQLNFAENKEIPRDRLIESYNALTHLKVNVSKLRTALREATTEGKEKSANFQTMVKLQLLVEQGKRLELSDSEMKEPMKVLLALRGTLDPLHDRLKQCTENAQSSKATIEDMNRLERKIDEASKEGIPSPLLFQAQEVLENLRNRVFTVKKRLEELTEESHYANPRPKCREELDQELALAQILEIDSETIEAAKQALENLNQEQDTARKELLKETLRAKFFYPSVRLMDKLKASVSRAEKSKLSNEFLNESHMVLTRMERRIFEHKELLSGIAQSMKVEEAGLPDLKNLEKMLKYAEKMEIPMEDLKDCYELLEKLKNRINPIGERLKTISHEAKQSTANLMTMNELIEQMKLAKQIHTPSSDMEEPKKLLKILRKIDDSINKAKIDLQTALKSKDLNLLTPKLNNVRNNQKQVLAWNPEDKEFGTLLEEAFNLETFLIQDLKDKHKKVEALSKEELRDKLQTAIHKKHGDWHDLRRLKNEYEKVCKKDGSEKDQKLLETVQRAYLQKTKEFVLNSLEEAIKSNAFENLENALKSVHAILETDIPSEKKDPKIQSTIKRAQTALSKIPERSRTRRQLLKEVIKTKMDKGSKMEELRGAIREFEDEFGSSVEDEEEKQLIVHAQHSIAVKIKHELMGQLQTSLKTQTVNDLGLAIAKVDSPLTQYLMEQYKIQDPEISKMAKVAKKIHVLECEVQRQLDNVLHLKDTDIKEVIDLQDPPTVVYESLKGTLFLLGFEEEEMLDWNQLKNLFIQINIKKLISDVKSIDVKPELAKKAEFINNLDSDLLKKTSRIASVFHSWSKSVVKRTLKE